MNKLISKLLLVAFAITANLQTSAAEDCIPTIYDSTVKVSKLEPDDFICEEHMLSGELESCSAKISIAVTSECFDELIYAYVFCKAELNYKHEGELVWSSLWKIEDEANSIVEIFNGQGPGELEFEWEFPLSMSKVHSAKVGNISCNIANIN